jgi:FlaA1/EpsC-like NDP-sugar epimerase
MSLVAALVRMYRPQHLRSTLLTYSFDCFTFALSVVLAFQLRFDGVVPAPYQHVMWVAVGIWTWVKSVAFMVGRINRGYWRYTSVHEVTRIVLANSLGSILGSTVIALSGTGIPRSVYILEWLVSCFLTVGGRLAVRMASTPKRTDGVEGERTKVLIYGSGAAGLALVQELSHNRSLMFDVVGLIDDDLQKVGLTFHGKRVLGSGENLKAWSRKLGVTRVLIAIPSASGPQMVRILKFVVAAGVNYKMVRSLGEAIQGSEMGKQIRDVAVEDLLGRKPVHLDQETIRNRIEGKVVMVTGAGGSIGSEICRQIARFNPSSLVGFDEAETPLFQIERELHSGFPHLVFHAEIGSIVRPDTLYHVMRRHRPSILCHAAAYKHVPMMERHVFAAVENNIFGTWQVALAAVKHGVEDFVMISSDKAVRPTSMMGATKRVAELVIHAMESEGRTRFIAVRFGNVLGSNGSVVPIFKEQIAAGGPVTVTHPEMCRYFMTIPEAAELVLQAFSIGEGGELFVLDMGEPVKIVDLARDLILLSGLQPDRDIRIQFTGLRPGEKLFEELNLHSEYLVPTSHPQIRSYLSPFHVDSSQIKLCLRDLQEAVDQQDIGRLVLLLKELIPDYNPGAQLLKLALSEPRRDPEQGGPGSFLGSHSGPVAAIRGPLTMMPRTPATPS